MKEEAAVFSELSPLATAVVEERAVVYVGGGASVPARLPSWRGLIERLYEDAAAAELAGKDKKKDSDYLRELVHSTKQYLEAADLLQDCFGDHRLNVLLEKCFDKNAMPSQIHRNIARIPFKMAITTNYDRLLESSYSESFCSEFSDNSVDKDNRKDTPLTWLDADDLLERMCENKFVVLKTHGQLGRTTSLVLNTRHYRDLLHKNPLFRQIFKWILMTRTCLFVGASLKDPDLLQLLYEGRSDSALSSEHYALLPFTEAPDIRIKSMKKDLKLTVIPIEPSQLGVDSMEKAIARVLIELSSQVAKKTIDERPPKLPTSDDPGFYLEGALKKLLEEAIKLTGSFRGDICLSKDDMGSHLSGELRHFVSLGPTDHQFLAKKEFVVPADSVCGVAYYQSSSERGIYVGDITSNVIVPDPFSNLPYAQIEYMQVHSDVRSELAVPIHADGVRVGVLNIESNLMEAYGPGHRAAALWFAEKAGRLFAAEQERKKRGWSLAHELVEGIYADLQRLLTDLLEYRCSQEKRKPLDFLIYRANYKKGKLRSQNIESTIHRKNNKNVSGKDARPEFYFEKHPDFSRKSQGSLVTQVFTKRRSFLCPDAEEATRKGEISNMSPYGLTLAGALLGFPIYVRGYIVGVMTAWRSGGKANDLGWQDMELLRRAAHLLGNASRNSKLAEVKSSESADKPMANLDKHIRDVIDRIKGIHNIVDIGRREIALKTNRVYPKPQRGVPVRVRVGGKEVSFEFRVKGANDLDHLLFEDWKMIAIRMALLLRQLQTRYQDERNYFLVPTRSRLWIRDRTDKKENKVCRFGLVLEVLLDDTGMAAAAASCSAEFNVFLKNLYEHNGKTGLLVVNSSRQDKPNSADRERAVKRGMFSTANVTSDLDEIKAHISPPDQYLSFLISRLDVDRFARQQRPLLGEDQNRKLLNKYQGAPWYVAPIQLISETIREHAQGEGRVLQDENDVKRDFVAYLTLDAPKGQKFELDEQQKVLQNELLHTLDLFTACCAELAEFRNLSSDEASHTKNF